MPFGPRRPFIPAAHPNGEWKWDLSASFGTVVDVGIFDNGGPVRLRSGRATSTFPRNRRGRWSVTVVHRVTVSVAVIFVADNITRA